MTISELPQARGDYRVTARREPNSEVTFVAWFNPGTLHWLVHYREIGFGTTITPPGMDKEHQIVKWEGPIET